MAGLTNCINVRPWGYNSSSNEPAVPHLPPNPPPPKAYNLHAAPMPRWAKKHTPVGTPGLAMPPLRRQDLWSNVNAKSIDGTPTTGYTPLALSGPPGLKSAPKTVPWSEKAASARTNSIATSGAIEPPKPDILSLAKSILSTSTNVADKIWWEHRVNVLAHYEIISLSRPLTEEETKKKDEITEEIIAKSRSGPLQVGHANFVPIPLPATAADIAALLAAHRRMGPPGPPAVVPPGPLVPPAAVPPVIIHAAPPGPPARIPPGPPARIPPGPPALPGQPPPPPIPARGPPGPPAVVHAPAQPGAYPGPPGNAPPRELITDPIGMGAPNGTQIVEYTHLPADIWKGAPPDSAFYIARPNVDRNRMEANLRESYHTGGMIPRDEKKIWAYVISVVNPVPLHPDDVKQRTGEDDVSYVMRATNRSRGRVLWAYLGDKKYYDRIMENPGVSLPDLVEWSSRGQFPLHIGMQLKPPM